MTKLKGIVFDLDGTLVDSLSTTFDAFNHGIVQHGGRVHTPTEIMEYFGPGEEQIFAEILGPEHAKSAYSACRAYTDANLHRVPLHSGVGELLETLKSAGTDVAIVTGRSWSTTEMILRHHGLLDRFVTVIANDHVKEPKPAAEGLLLALQRMQLLPSEALYVGDMPVDVQAAHSAGAESVAALWDAMANRTELQAKKPHYWAHTPLEILKIRPAKPHA